MTGKLTKAQLRSWERKLVTMHTKVSEMQSQALVVFGEEYEGNITDDFDNISAEIEGALERISAMRRLALQQENSRG